MTTQRSAAEDLAAIIRKHYDLGEVGVPSRLKQAHQRRHRKLVVETSKGNFLIKTYKRDLGILDALRFQHRLSDHLAKNGLPVARIQPARNGKRIVEIDTWALELQQYLEGDPMQITPKTLSLSGRALGKFHEVSRDFPRPDRDTRMWRFSEVPRETFGALYQQAKIESNGPEVDAQCNRIALFLRDASKELSLEARDRFETGLIHGDWHGGNLLFSGDKLAGIVDLEFAGDGCFLEDLAYGVSNLCIRTTVEPKRLEGRMDILLDNYQNYRRLAQSEERALHYAVGIKHVTTVSYQWRQLGGKLAGHNAASWMERLDAQCAWLAQRAAGA